MTNAATWAWLDRFIHPAHTQPTMRTRAEFLAICALVTIAGSLVVNPSYFDEDFLGTAALLMVALCGCSATLILLRSRPSIHPAATTYALTLVTGMSATVWIDHSVASTAWLWLATVPMVATLFSNWKTGTLVLVIVVGLMVTVLASDFPRELPYGWPVSVFAERLLMEAAMLAAIIHLIAGAYFSLMRKQAVELQRLNEQLEAITLTDQLTGARNRRFLDERLPEVWRGLGRRRAELSLLVVDVDFFKRFNDSAGHEAGDRCLVVVTDVLKAAVNRAEDAVIRYGGEEFLIVLPDTPGEGAIEVAERIHSGLKQRSLVHPDSDLGDRVTVSIGAATVRCGAINHSRHLFVEADKALYAAKEAGRNRTSQVTLNPTLEQDGS